MKKTKDILQDEPSIVGSKPKKKCNWTRQKSAELASQRKLSKIQDVDWSETPQGAVIREYIDGKNRQGPPKKGESTTLEDPELNYERRKILIGLEILRDPSQWARAISRITGIPRETVRDIIRKEDFKIDMSVVISKLGQRVLENAIEANDALNDIFMSETASVFIPAKDLMAIADKNIRLYSYMKWENVNADGTEKEFQFRFADNLLEAGIRQKVPKEDFEEEWDGKEEE